MDWKSIKHVGQKVVGETAFDLRHLQDARYAFTIGAAPKYPELSFEVLVQYSSHCISWGPKHGRNIDFATFGEDRRIVDDKGIHRCFCEDRYALSHMPPDIFSTLTDRHCLFTGRENWLTIEISDAYGNLQEYEVLKKQKAQLRAYCSRVRLVFQHGWNRVASAAGGHRLCSPVHIHLSKV